MRVTSSMYYQSLYGTNNLKINNELFDVNKQIASGLKIQYASDDVTTFTKTMQLDNEMTTIGQIKKSTESGYKVSNQTDVVLNEFETAMDRTRTLLLNAANGTHSVDSLDAIANELRGLEKHFKNLANTSINGQFLFSGTAVDTKPIADDGTYKGNDKTMNAFLGSNNQQQYNLSGADLFLGEDSLVKRNITSNVILENLSKKSFDASNTDSANSITITTSDTIRDLMGDTDNTSDAANKHHFYVRGVKSDGTAFNAQIDKADDDSVESLLKDIGKLYGNTANVEVVNVGLNPYGQITIEDKMKGSSKLDFHMVGAVDFNQADGNDEADINDAVYAGTLGQISNLDGGETNFVEIINPTPPAVANDLYVKEFVKSPYASGTSDISNIDGLLYDRTQFAQDGAQLSSSVAQILKGSNEFATPSTKISEVADLSQGTAGTLDGTQLLLSGNKIDGSAFTPPVQIDFKTSGSTFSLDGGATNFDIYDMDSNGRKAVPADEMTYQQLMDVINMSMTNSLPAANTATDYDNAVTSSNTSANTYLTYDGKIAFTDLLANTTQATISLYDANSGDFNASASALSFNANNALTIVDPKTDFFKNLNDAITAVEDHKLYPDTSSGDLRNTGIENALTMLDKLQSHISREHAKVGAQSNTLTNSLERTSLLEISTMTLRSDVVDTDLAEASLKLNQLTLNYQAMLSTVGKVSKLSLVNYL
ncbi:flagellar biosynthesis protein FlgL [Sulfurimonas sp.]|uniref:flagellin N-terminal helical domain-containing protein n=1 Tax=Sulfurimonas sp. TaxID=2022749 RepID=UPI00260907B7|nr:flagellar biosynthesis protein FlgL [Sulfurimonas sp.]